MAFIESGKSFDKKENEKKMKERMKNMESTVYNFHIPTRLHTAFKQLTAQRRTSMKEVLIEFIEIYIKG